MSDDLLIIGVWLCAVALLGVIAAALWAGWQVKCLRREMGRRITILAVLWPAAVHGQQREFVGPQPQVKVERLWTPTEAQTNALADLLTLPELVRPRIRYIWVKDGTVESVKSVTRTLNCIARGPTMRPVPLANNQLLRVDLASLAYDIDKELQGLIEWFEEYRFDYNFSQLITPDMLAIILKSPQALWPVPIIRTGNKFEISRLDQLAEADVIRVPTGDPIVVGQLQLSTLSSAPVVSKEYFELRTVRQFQGEPASKDNRVFRKVWSGQYYRAANIRKSTDPKLNDFKALLKELGAPEDVNSEQRLAVRRSAITGSTRAIEARPTGITRVSDGRSVIIATFDVRHDSTDASQNALRTLDGQALNFDGMEVLFTRRNGQIGAALFNKQQNLVNEVPQQIATDRTVPSPHHAVLEPMISCDRCHTAAGHSGWQPAKNHVKTLLGSGYDIFGDTSRPNERVDQTVKRLAEQYRGDLDGFFTTARFDYQRATLAATGAWPNSPPTGIATQAAKKLQKDIEEYWYNDVTAQAALRDQGLEVPKTFAQTILNMFLAPDEDSRVFGFIPEDVIIATLKSGEGISRQDYAFVFPFITARFQKNAARMMKDNKPKESP